MSDFSFRQLQKCAEREVALRLRVYAKQPWTEKRESETRMMTAIAAHFKDLADGDEMAGRNPAAQMFIRLRDGKSVYLPLYEEPGYEGEKP